jgi:hypothetical protein
MKLVENRRTIRWRPVKRLDQQLEVTTDNAATGSASGTDHTHGNKTFLDSLSADFDGRLTRSGHVINVPLLDEQW